MQIKELFIYDFKNKKYISKGSCKFSIEFDNSDKKSEKPILVFRNSALQMIFQGIYNKEFTYIENYVRENNKYFTIIQKVMFLNQENENKKIECKSLKLSLYNKDELDLISEKFSNLKNNDIYFDSNDSNNNNNDKEEKKLDYYSINNNTNNSSLILIKENNDNINIINNNYNKSNYFEKLEEKTISNVGENLNDNHFDNYNDNNNNVIIIDQKIEISVNDLKIGKKIQINLTILPEDLSKKN
jgi:hypothetical protein